VTLVSARHSLRQFPLHPYSWRPQAFISECRQHLFHKVMEVFPRHECVDAPCASPEVHRVSEWRHRCLSRLRFLRSAGRPAAQPEATTCPWWPDGGPAMSSDYVLTPKIRFSFTRTTECSRPQSLRSTSLTPLLSSVEARAAPTVAGDAILANHTQRGASTARALRET
jgi:hypothetical protein